MTTPASLRSHSTKFEDHKGLLHKWAVKFYARLLVAKVIGIDFDDVLAELNIPFVHSQRAYRAEKGYTFTAYLGRACQNHFNKYAERLLCEQYGDNAADRGFDPETSVEGGLGYISIGQMGEPGFDFLETIEQSAFAAPDDVMDAKMTLSAIDSDASLLEETRAFIAYLASPADALPDDMRKRIKSKGNKVRAELQSRYGVEFREIRL